ncbi:MAG: hypothetical protein WCI92_03980 [Bacteroidota bacterium]
MKNSLLQSLISFFTLKDAPTPEHPDHFDKIETVQDALEKLKDLYSPHDLTRCDEISDLRRTLKDAHSFNPLTPLKTLPTSKKHLIRKYL